MPISLRIEVISSPGMSLAAPKCCVDATFASARRHFHQQPAQQYDLIDGVGFKQ
jgi:hypothetical protein